MGRVITAQERIKVNGDRGHTQDYEPAKVNTNTECLWGRRTKPLTGRWRPCPYGQSGVVKWFVGIYNPVAALIEISTPNDAAARPDFILNGVHLEYVLRKF